MKWKHIGIYESLTLKGFHQKKSNREKYISVSANEFSGSFAIIYHPVESQERRPLHLKINHPKWPDELGALKALVQQWPQPAPDSNGWQRFEVADADWDALAVVLELD